MRKSLAVFVLALLALAPVAVGQDTTITAYLTQGTNFISFPVMPREDNIYRLIPFLEGAKFWDPVGQNYFDLGTSQLRYHVKQGDAIWVRVFRDCQFEVTGPKIEARTKTLYPRWNAIGGTYGGTYIHDFNNIITAGYCWNWSTWYYPMTGWLPHGAGVWVYALEYGEIGMGQFPSSPGFGLGKTIAVGDPPSPPWLESVWILSFRQDSTVSTVYPTNTVGLMWETGWESENDSFTPWRRVNGGPWEKVLPGNGKVFGLGSSQSGKTYYCQDNGLPGFSGQVDYMLTSLGYDGVVDTCKYFFSVHLGPTTSVADLPSAQPAGYTLSQNYPNPFNPETNICYQLSATEAVELTVYNMLGQKIRSLVDGQIQSAGEYAVRWDGRDEYGQQVAAGMYIYHIQAGSFTATRKMIFSK